MLYFPDDNPDETRELHARDTRNKHADVPICMHAFDLKFACWVGSREDPTAPVAAPVGAASAAATMANERSKMDILCSSEVIYIHRLGRFDEDGNVFYHKDKYKLRKLRMSFGIRRSTLI